jgi:hypothetical protein
MSRAAEFLKRTRKFGMSASAHAPPPFLVVKSEFCGLAGYGVPMTCERSAVHVAPSFERFKRRLTVLPVRRAVVETRTKLIVEPAGSAGDGSATPNIWMAPDEVPDWIYVVSASAVATAATLVPVLAVHEEVAPSVSTARVIWGIRYISARLVRRGLLLSLSYPPPHGWKMELWPWGSKVPIYALGLAEALGLCDAEGLTDGDREAEGLRDADGLWLAEGLAEREGLGLCEAEGEPEALGDAERDGLGLSLAEGLADDDGLALALGLTDGDTEGLREAEGETDAEAAGTLGAVSSSANVNTTLATESVSQAISSKSAPKIPSFKKQMYLRLESDSVPDPPESVNTSLLPLLLAALILR